VVLNQLKDLLYSWPHSGCSTPVTVWACVLCKTEYFLFKYSFQTGTGTNTGVGNQYPYQHSAVVMQQLVPHEQKMLLDKFYQQQKQKFKQVQFFSL
jgi:hypothetical protein